MLVVNTQENADKHLELMKFVDKVQVINFLKNAIDDPSGTVDNLVNYLHKARVDSYNIGAGKTDPVNGLTKRHGEKDE
jgi:hypothetical protein